MNSTSPLVSIVIPVYNGEKYIGEAIDSILGQNYPNIELVVLDDGSIDNTEEILKKYNSRLFWDKHTNMGQANTLNKGWLMSKGTLLSYLSADDTLLPNAVSISVQYLQANPDVVLTYCDFNLIDPKSRLIRRVTAPDFSYRDMVVKQVCHPGPGVFFRRYAFESAGGWDSTFRQMPDYEYWLRIGLLGRFLHIPEVLATFRIHDESQTFSKAGINRSEEPITIISRFFQRQNLPDKLLMVKDEALSNAHLLSAQLHWRAGRFRQGYLTAKKAFLLYPRNLISIRTVRMIINALFNRTGHKLFWFLKDIFYRNA